MSDVTPSYYNHFELKSDSEVIEESGMVMFEHSLRPEVKSKYLEYACLDQTDQLSFLHDDEIVFLDFEATGVDPSKDEIIEIGALLVRGAKIVDSFNTLVKPPVHIPAYIVYTTNITDEMVKDSPLIGEVFPNLSEFIGQRPVVAFADFERQFLKRYYQELLGASFENKYFDMLELSRIILPSLSSHRQVDIAAFFNIPVQASHRAYDDVKVLTHLYWILLRGVSLLDRQTLRQIIGLSPQTGWLLRELFAQAEKSCRKNQNRKTEDRASPQMEHVSEASLNGTAEELQPLEGEKLKAIFAEKGLLASAFDAYEIRKEQLEMVLSCARALNEKKHLVVEAGTGTGKSLAYLVPSIYFAVQNDLRVVVSTKSINLQDQLFLKDLPFLHHVLDIEFRSSVLKGYSNYLCRRKLWQFLAEGSSLTTEQIALTAMLLAWLSETEDGDVSRLNIHTDHGLWSEVCGSPSGCFKNKCPWRNQNRCFYYRARERAKCSHLVIVNHSLLLEDLKLGERLLPEANFLVIDEAHVLEDEATDRLTKKLAGRELFHLIESLYLEKGAARSGFLLAVLKRLPKGKAISERNEITKIVNGLFDSVKKTGRSSELYFRSLCSLWKDGVQDESYFYHEARITAELEATVDWANISFSGNEFLGWLSDLQKGLEFLFEALEAAENKGFGTFDEVLVDLSSYILRLAEASEVLEAFLKGFSPRTVSWVNLSSKNDLDGITVSVVPLEVGNLLAEQLFAKKESIIMTSATLMVSGSFDYFLTRIGLDQLTSADARSKKNAYSTVQLPSSFDLERQTKVFLASDFGDPNSKEYETDIAGFLCDVHRATDGGVLTLFTSNRLMQRVYFKILDPLAKEGLIVFCQNVGASRQKLTRDFIVDRKASLFGTASFWEGFDASGDTLRCIVITRLPFSRPNQPVIEARCQALEEKGLSSFDSYLLPQAVLKLKQGVGRLIRSKTDRGLVIITDSRLCRKSYARQFMSALPGCKHEMKPRSEVVEDIAKWMNDRQ